MGTSFNYLGIPSPLATIRQATVGSMVPPSLTTARREVLGAMILLDQEGPLDLILYLTVKLVGCARAPQQSARLHLTVKLVDGSWTPQQRAPLRLTLREERRLAQRLLKSLTAAYILGALRSCWSTESKFKPF